MPFGYIGQNQTKQKVKNSGVLSSFDVSLLEKKGQAGGSLELIESQTISSTVAQVDFTSIKENLYDVHLLVLKKMTTENDNKRVTLRFFESGTIETASVYHHSSFVLEAGGRLIKAKKGESVHPVTNLDAYDDTKFQIRISAKNLKATNPTMYNYLVNTGDANGNKFTAVP